ncbi:inner membrane protein yieG [Magnaporthiopsis poae ATCC 64411]|uniref:Inner membrane protein yieG n=1 Tax=Magnaporthiopsis poae (strain ATCC 64411 / 73-15) TaxID=644358 RepID=A0A0C4EBA3_MAGP6|nr:inner membrane protein yieG [Magnaporthiopsis poae ATCC 64411]
MKLKESVNGAISGALDRIKSVVTRIDERVNQSTFGRVFRLRGCGHENEIHDATFSRELRAGLTTFATMVYIIAVNAHILADTGANCVCKNKNDLGLCSNETEYIMCQNGEAGLAAVADSRIEVRRDLVTATAAVAGFSSIVFGFLTNLPVALAPGMGLNAYFTYQVVGVRGSGGIPYGLALTAVFVEGFIFILLAVTGMRHWMVKIIPGTLKTASGVGIGLFLTLTGMSYGNGIGLITGSVSTPLAIGGCPPEYLIRGECPRDIMKSHKMWLGIFGGLLTAWLMAFRVRSAIIIGVAAVSILSWPRNTSISYFPHTAEGDSRFEFFSRIVEFHPIKHTLSAQEWDLSGKGTRFMIALVTFLYVDIIDCTATLYSMARFCGKVDEKDGDFPRSTLAYCTDAALISFGSLLGCSPVTVFVESGAGIAEGGRTGLTAITTGICFLLAIFFAPIFASIPPWATGCTLILVGCLMIRQVTCVNWNYISDALPSFVTIALIPFSYSVAYGLIAGIFTYTVLNSLIWLVIFISRGELEPKDYGLKEYWTWRPAGRKPWLIRLFTKGQYWAEERLHSKRDAEEERSIQHSQRSAASSEEKANEEQPSASMPQPTTARP